MKTAIIIYMLIQLSSAASAEIYTWEDANGINFSDNPSSMSEEYREEAFDEPGAQINNTTPQERVGTTQQKRPIITHEYQTAVYQADLEQQRRALVTIKQQQARSSAVSAKIDKETFPSLASLVVVWIIIALFLIIVWVVTIADMAGSDYITPSTKTVWMLLVVFIPLIGMLLYYILGINQKFKSNSCNEKQHFKTLSRFN